MTETMRVALGQMRDLDRGRLRFIRQLGVKDIIFNTPALPGENCWEFMDLLHLRQACEDEGLRLGAIENVPHHFYDRVMLGLPGREEQIENYRTTIRNMGRAGITILGYHWMPNSVWRTSRTTRDRGGARVTSFDLDLVKDAPLSHGREYTAEEMWDNYAYFMKAVLPVAEEEGVRLALHPDDPPVESLAGIPRIFRCFEGFKRAMNEFSSAYHGLDFCQGCWSEMGTDVPAAIRHFAQRGKIVYVHFRDVKGTVPSFRECFINEGNVDMFEAIRAYRDAGFRGMLIPDHVPSLQDDGGWSERARAHAVGYMTALLEIVERF